MSLRAVFTIKVNSMLWQLSSNAVMNFILALNVMRKQPTIRLKFGLEMNGMRKPYYAGDAKG